MPLNPIFKFVFLHLPFHSLNLHYETALTPKHVLWGTWGESWTWWYWLSIWHECSLWHLISENVISHMKIQNGSRYSRRPPCTWALLEKQSKRKHTFTTKSTHSNKKGKVWIKLCSENRKKFATFWFLNIWIIFYSTYIIFERPIFQISKTKVFSVIRILLYF